MEHPSVLHGIIDGRTVRLKLAYELLEVNPHKFVFAGKRTIRGIPADVWVAEKLPDNSDDPYSTIEIFFADPKYTVQIEEVNEMKSVPLGMITHHASSITAPSFHSKVVNHYYHFTNSPPHWKVGGIFSELGPTQQRLILSKLFLLANFRNSRQLPREFLISESGHDKSFFITIDLTFHRFTISPVVFLTRTDFI